MATASSATRSTPPPQPDRRIAAASTTQVLPLPTLPTEHQQLFDFAFEHFSGGHWQRAAHKKEVARRAKLQQQEQQKGLGLYSAAFSNAAANGHATSPSGGDSGATAVMTDDTPCMPLNALSSLLLGVGCIIGTAEELRGAVAKTIVDYPSPQAPAEDDAEDADVASLRLSYNQALRLMATLPTVLPPQLYGPYGKGGAVVKGPVGLMDTATAAGVAPPQQQQQDPSSPPAANGAASSTPANSAFTANLPQVMEAIRLFVMFEKHGRLPLQALRTVLATMGEEPLTQGELDYLLHPYSTGGGNGHTSESGLTLLQYLDLFKLL